MRERGVDDDAVGVVDLSVTLERERAVHFTPQRPAHVDRDRAHFVERAFPLGDDETGLLLDLARQAGEHVASVSSITPPGVDQSVCPLRRRLRTSRRSSSIRAAHRPR